MAETIVYRENEETDMYAKRIFFPVFRNRDELIFLYAYFC